jgi:DNA-binding transcriptional ArsR family regulator
MSIVVIAWAWRQKTRSPISKLLLVKLADHSHEDGGGCFPKVSTIVADTGLGDRTVRQHLRYLEEQGLIATEPVIDARGQKANSYRLLIATAPGSVRVTATSANVPRPRQALRQQHGGAAVAAHRPLRMEQSHIDTNRQNEPSSNGAPKRTQPLSGRALQLAKLIGDAQYMAWFGEAEFLEGNPLRIIFPKLMKRNWVIDRYGKRICDLFGVAVIFEVQPAADLLPETALALR